MWGNVVSDVLQFEVTLNFVVEFFFFYCYGALRDLHSFPTRRSSDLKGLFWKVIVPMITSPIAGLVLGFFVMASLYVIFRNARPLWINRIFGRAQMASAGAMGFMHGTNDAQKTMGIIALTLLAATKAGQLDSLPHWLSFLHTAEPPAGKDVEIRLWIKVVCALTMAAGTALGGWRIIKTLGHKM